MSGYIRGNAAARGIFANQKRIGIPAAPSDPVEFLAWCLEHQQPFHGPGVTLSPDFVWLFDDADGLTDLVQGEVLSVGGGSVGRTTFADLTFSSPDRKVDIQSPLAKGFASFDNVADSLVAADSSVMDLSTSGLILWCIRVPTLEGSIMGVAGKRETGGDFKGYRIGVNQAGQVLADIDTGVDPSDTLSQTQNTADEQTLGSWHWHGVYVDASRSANGLWMLGSDQEISTTEPRPPGSLTSTAVFSIGAGSLYQAKTLDVMAVVGFFGSQVEGLLHNPKEPASATNDPTGPNLVDNVLAQLARHTIRAIPEEAIA